MKLTIRRADQADTRALVEMGQAFLEQTSYGTKVALDVKRQADTVAWLLREGAMFVVVDDTGDEPVGMLGVVIIPSPVSADQVATEIAWWMEPAFRGSSAAVRMLKQSIAWAREQGADAYQMLAPAGSPVGKVYARLGFEELETVWQLRLA